MHDFNCRDAKDMNFALMAERTRYLKEDPKGVEEMCKSMEDMRNEADLAAKKKIALNLIRKEIMSYEDIAECAELSMEEVRILADKKGA